MARLEATPQVEFDGTGGWSSVRGVHETNEERDLALDIYREDDRGPYLLQVRTTHPELVAAFGDDLKQPHRLHLDRSTLWGAVQRCRQAWRSRVIDRKDNDVYTFQEAWDLSSRRGITDEILPLLAEAGAGLFLEIFKPRPANPRPYESLRRVGGVLARELPKHSLWIRITSPDFYAPWSMIYSGPPVGAPPAREHFWGYQHLIEHSPDGAGNLGYELVPQRPFRLGLQLDNEIDTEFKVECLAPVLQLFDRYADTALQRASRLRKTDLRDALTSSDLRDQILYFCCHAEQEGDSTAQRIDEGYLVLTDRPRNSADNRITPADVRTWMYNGPFPNKPLVFLNACGAGQFNSTFYEGFGSAFLGQEACCVVGPQTEVPAVLAGEFARRFFERFLGSGRKVGHILHTLRREFLDQHANPLGLIYSLYRGADTRIEPALESGAGPDVADD